MVARMSPLFELSPTALNFVLFIGATTAFFTGLIGIVQNDIKRVVAYSTLSQLGYMTVALGVSAYSAAVFHLMTHAFFKALLFLAAGSVIIGMHHEQDMRKMGGLRKYMPITWITSLVGTLPLVGTEGSLSDLETALVEFEPPAGALVTTQLLVADGTPSAVVDRVRAASIGLSDPRSIDGTLRELRGDAFSLGLRLFLVVGVATLLIAILGVFASAVLQSRWRSYEVAALRVVGVGQRTLVRASVLEYVVLLGVAVLLGVLSAYLSLQLVLPSISLGTAAATDPAPVYATPWLVVTGVAALLFVLATLIAVLVSRRITRLGRPSTLRWAEQG
jgi:hypothetical protein